MSLLYLMEITNPQGETTQGLPPSVMESEWYASLSAACVNKGVVTSTFISTTLRFDNQTEYTAWVEQYKLTDRTLLDDIRVWSEAHGLSHRYEVYTDDDTVVTPLKIISLD